MKQDIIEVEIEDFAYGRGEGVGRIDNYVIFVPWTVSKDRVKVRLNRKRASYADAELLKIIRESPDRVRPRCEAFTKCGGCNLQNLSYEKQLKLKENQLIQSLKRIGHIDLIDVELLPIIPSPKLWFYRNKMEFSFGSSDDEISLGLHPKGSYKEIVDLDDCPIFSPQTGAILRTVKEFAKKRRMLPYDNFSHKGMLRHLIVREAKFTNRVMINLVATQRVEGMEELRDMLIEKIVDIKTILWTQSRKIADAVIPDKEEAIMGNRYILESMNGISFKITPWSFFQPNPYITLILYKRIIDFIKEDKTILDLFSGSGGVSLFLAREGKKVIGIELNRKSVESAIDSMKMNGIRDCEFIEGDVRKVLYERKEWRGKIDAAIVDPPRSGLSKKIVKRIVELKAPKIVYVSCNPSTLSRDIALFKESRYSLKKIQPLDMFPHTHHIETIALLSYD